EEPEYHIEFNTAELELGAIERSPSQPVLANTDLDAGWFDEEATNDAANRASTASDAATEPPTSFNVATEPPSSSPQASVMDFALETLPPSDMRLDLGTERSSEQQLELEADEPPTPELVLEADEPPPPSLELEADEPPPGVLAEHPTTPELEI